MTPTKMKGFNKAVDVRTGFRTKSILCAPLRTVSGEEIGVSQYTKQDRR